MKFRDYVNLNRADFCTGCSACSAVCSVGALHMVQDEFGYYVSEFDASKCINCGRCDEICPILSPKSYPLREKNPSSFAVQAHDDIRKQCSSGGVFLAAAQGVIESTGGTVFGAAWKNDILYHCGVNDINELSKLCGSKYVQSNVDGIFIQIKTLLNNGEKVLFCGCPCQVSGLYSYLGKDHENLFTIDLLCYYAPSIKMFQNYLNETYNGEARAWSFRDKELGWSSENFTVIVNSAAEIKSSEFSESKSLDETLKKIIRKRSIDIYEQAFHSHLLMSEHCSNCKFNRIPRQGDISIDDLWGIAQFDNSFDDNKGTSIAIINSDKGMQLLKLCEKKIKRIKKTSLKYIKGNRIGKAAAVGRSDECKRFYDLYKSSCNFTQSSTYALSKKHDIAVTGCWNIKNYGSQLTYYALYKTLNNLGYSVVLIGNHKKAPYKSNGTAELFKNNPYPQYDVACQFDNKIEMLRANSMADTFIIGSDQVWKNSLYKYFGEFTLLDFVFSNKNKISYAASFGENFWNGDETERAFFQFCLNRFNKISVRETSGVRVCKNEFNCTADWVIDPVFLAGANVFSEISSHADINISGKYVFAYLLDYSSDKVDLLRVICNKLGCECIVVTDPNLSIDPSWKDYVHVDYSLEDWLWLFKNSEYVLTDSFHGMCVSLIFNKNFTALVNDRRGSARFNDYSDMFELNDYILRSSSEAARDGFELSHVDYEKINKLISKAVDDGTKWLINAIGSFNEEPLTSYDENIITRYENSHKKLKYRIMNSKIIRYQRKYGFRVTCGMALRSLRAKLKK